MTRRLRSVTGCNCSHRKEPLAIAVIIRIEHDKPELTFNSNSDLDVERMRHWLRERPELQALVLEADDLRRAA